jgi:hypothetical protein
MARNTRRVEDTVDAEGWVTSSGYTAWDCEKCKREVRRFRGQSDVDCECGACYNAFGQRLRDDWRGNPSVYDDEIGDMEGFEIQQLRKEGSL